MLQRTSQLEAANKELEAFVYSASHDLRAPLRAIDGFSQMIVEDAADRLDADDVEHLQRVRAAARRMALLIDHLISLSRTARQDLLRAPTDLSAMAASVLADLQDAQPERRRHHGGRAGPHRRRRRRAPPRDPHQPAGERVEVHLAPRDGAHRGRGARRRTDERAFFVKDDGVGFDPEQAEHLFGAFQRYHSAEEFEGDGIGLATVQRLVAKHGGRVWAEAEVDKGATFFFTLPAPAGD